MDECSRVKRAVGKYENGRQTRALIVRYFSWSQVRLERSRRELRGDKGLYVGIVRYKHVYDESWAAALVLLGREGIRNVRREDAREGRS